MKKGDTFLFLFNILVCLRMCVRVCVCVEYENVGV